jgi:hypothetical protein
MHVVDVIDLGVARQSHPVVGLALLGKRRRQPGQCLKRGSGARVFIVVEDHPAVRVGARNDSALEPALGHGNTRSPLALHSKGVHIRSREALHGGD